MRLYCLCKITQLRYGTGAGLRRGRQNNRKAGRGDLYVCADVDVTPASLEEDGRLHDPQIRENFVERIYALQAQRYPSARLTRGALIDYHSR